MNDFVDLSFKRNRGWPWPEDSWGLTPMYGDDGWCHACGVPKRHQSGSMVLQRKDLTRRGAWVPYWRYEAICVEQSLANEIAGRFQVDLRPVAWRREPEVEASQLVVTSTKDAWFDREALADKAIARHGLPGKTCPECGVWRWMPLAFGMLPPLCIEEPLGGLDIAASPEWFGAGCNSFRQLLVRRELAELIAAASPRDFSVREVS